MKLPMRARILELMSDNTTKFAEEVYIALGSEYGNEGQYKQSKVLLHLYSMRAVGLLADSDVSLDTNGELIEGFKITGFGLSRLKYLA